MSLTESLFPKQSTSVGLIAVSLAMGSGQALAEAELQLEEVVVTAQKREQNLQDVPVSVVAVSGAAIQSLGIERMDDLSNYIPTVTISQGAGENAIFIRGIGSGVNKGFEQSVGLFIDGVYYGRGRSVEADLLDVARVEVLKGPQGILFGKNTIAGAISVTTVNPGPEASGHVAASYEFEDDSTSIEGAYGGPLTDTFGMRLAVKASEIGGWSKNTYTNHDLLDSETLSARLSTLWQPTDTLEIIGKLQYSTVEFSEKPAELSTCSAATAALVAGIDDCTFNRRTTIYAIDEKGKLSGEEFSATSLGLTVNWEVGDHTLTSVTSYTKHDDDFYYDVDFTHLDSLSVQRDEDYENFSEEIRIASVTGRTVDYLAGVYFEANRLDHINNFALVAANLSRVNAVRQDGESIAAFAQLTWNATDQISVTAGGRYSEDRKEIDFEQFFAPAKLLNRLPITDAGALGEVFALEDKRTDTNFSPAATIEWKPDPDYLLYARYSEGFKAGGYDMALSRNDFAHFVFKPEEAKSFEIGSKNTLLGGAMTLNATAYYSEYDNLQVSTFDGQANFNVGNAAQAISRGVDVELAWVISREFSTRLSLSYLDAYYDSFPTAQCSYPQQLATPSGTPCLSDLAGEPLQFAPEWSGHWNLTWRRPVGAYLLEAATDVSFMDDYFVANDLDPEMQQDAFAKLDVRLALHSEENGWEVALLGRNLTDKSTFQWGNDVPLAPGTYFKVAESGRTVALQLRAFF